MYQSLHPALHAWSHFAIVGFGFIVSWNGGIPTSLHTSVSTHKEDISDNIDKQIAKVI